MGVVPLPLWVARVGRVLRQQVQPLRIFQSVVAAAQIAQNRLVRERVACSIGSSAGHDLICFRKLLTRTFRKGRGLVGKELVVSNETDVL